VFDHACRMGLEGIVSKRKPRGISHTPEPWVSEACLLGTRSRVYSQDGDEGRA
jgi:hypothetical protein